MFNGDKNGIVDLEVWTCSCRRFQLDQLSCAHVMIAIRHLRRDMYEYCFDYYSLEHWKSTYVRVDYPLPHKSDWIVPDDVREIKALPLDVRTICGHRRKHRFPSVGKTINRHKYNRCGEHGHHRKTCQNLIALHPSQCASSSGTPSCSSLYQNTQHFQEPNEASLTSD